MAMKSANLTNKLGSLAERLGVPAGMLSRLSYTPEQKYTKFEIPKRRGGVRIIHKPEGDLHILQRLINRRLLNFAPEQPDCVMAFRLGRSISDNARRHSAKAVVVKFDLKDFFPSISFTRVNSIFKSIGLTEEESRTLAFITTTPCADSHPKRTAPVEIRTLKKQVRQLQQLGADAASSLRANDRVLRHIYEDGADASDYFGGDGDLAHNLKQASAAAPSCMRRSLPQGAPTSPQLANLAAKALDSRLVGLGKSLGFVYTRYADDLTFSSEDPKAKVDVLKTVVAQIVADCGFWLNESKTIVMRAPNTQRVTGLITNGKSPRVPRDTIRRIRAMMHSCTSDPTPKKIDQLRGYLSFVRMVNRDQADKLLRNQLKLRDILVEKSSRSDPPPRSLPANQAADTAPKPSEKRSTR